MKLKDFEVSTYDLLGYFLPGLLMIAQVFAFFRGFKSLYEKINQLTGSEIVFLIIGAYILGHLIQSISNILDSLFQRIPVIAHLSGGTTYQYLSNKNKIHSLNFKNAIRESAKNLFKLDQITEKELFNLCYSFVSQKIETTKLDLFVSLYGFYRALSYTCLIGTILFLIRWNLLPTFIFLICWLLFLQRYKRFRAYFEDYVYRDFYIYYLTHR